MSFKDKLKTIKKGKQPVKKIPKISDDGLEGGNNFPSLDDFSQSASNAVDDLTTNATSNNALPNTEELSGANNDNKLSKFKKPKGKLKSTKPKKFSKTTKKSPKAKSKSSKSGTSNQTKLIALALLTLVALGAVGFLLKDTLFGTDAEKVVATQPKDKAPVANTTPTDNTDDAKKTEPNVADSKKEEDSVQSDQATTGDAKTKTAEKDNVQKFQMLDEKITSDLPNTQVEAAEELDSLADESNRLDDRTEELSQLITAKEELMGLKQKKIEMLEKQIAEAEAAAKQQTSATE